MPKARSFDRQIAINLKGTFNRMREASKRLRNGGRVVNLSTSVVGTKLETCAVCAATKGVHLLLSIVRS
jgi:3-oxoacyl-[acyl-carrier protein] reductase